MDYVAAHHQPGELVLAALPPPAYLSLGESDDLMFLAGPRLGVRARDHVLQDSSGRYLDYWLGVDAVISPARLCSLINESPNLWIVVDEQRLNLEWALGGPMGEIIQGLTWETYKEPGAASVRRPIPPGFRDDHAAVLCSDVSQQPSPLDNDRAGSPQ
jgi:hypothetical protein